MVASAHFYDSAAALLAAVTEQTGPFPLIGCVAEAVVGGAREVESEPAVSLWLAAEVGPVETFAMDFVRTASGGAFGGYRFEPGQAGVCLMICDPFTFPADYLLAHLNAQASGTLVMGGMASGGLGDGRASCSSTAASCRMAPSAPTCPRPRFIRWSPRAAGRSGSPSP